MTDKLTTKVFVWKDRDEFFLHDTRVDERFPDPYEVDESFVARYEAARQEWQAVQDEIDVLIYRTEE